MSWVCPVGHGSIDKSRIGTNWGYRWPRCWDCGREAVSLKKLIDIAKEEGRIEEVKWKPGMEYK